MPYTLQERIKIVQLFYSNGRSQMNLERAWRAEYGRNSRTPHHLTVTAIITKFEESGTVADAPKSGRLSRQGSEEVKFLIGKLDKIWFQSVASVDTALKADPRSSVRRIAQETGISVGCTHRIMRHVIGAFPYKITKTFKQEEADKAKRVNSITPDLMKRVSDNLLLRTAACVMMNGEHLDGIVDE
jgi:hypothetical protein